MTRSTTALIAGAAALITLAACETATVEAETGDLSRIDLAEQMGADPVYADPQTIDPDFPPAIAELAFESHGARLNGIAYLANGPGPHPTFFILHGFPGNEKSLDVAQSLRRAGFNTVFFHYRGAWGSGGAFSFANVIEDVAVAKAYVAGRASDLRIDPDKIGLIGHSMGGFAALHAAARDPGLTCVGGLAAADFGATAQRLSKDAEARAGFEAYSGYLAAGPLSGTSGEALVAEVVASAEAFNVRALASRLAGKRVLLIAANSDEAVNVETVHEPMSAAFAAQDGLDLTSVRLDGDHSFSWTREALTREVLAWADGCR
ncbi:MAG: alpha/beta fold hydrolase [Pseudomonadota bacterium]